MSHVISELNNYTLPEILNVFPHAKTYAGNQCTFDYRIYTQHGLAEVEVLYVLMNGFGVRADHGIEEHRALSTPFLVKPELYWITG